MLYKPSRPLEYVCLFPADVPTQVDGDVFLFIAVDAYTQFMFNTGVEKDREPHTVLKHIALLMKDKEFMRHRDNGFTLVLHKYQEQKDAIEAIIKPYNGKVIFDDPYLSKIVMPVLEVLFKHFANNKPR